MNDRSMAHFVSRFPVTSETFIMADMMAISHNWPNTTVFSYFDGDCECPSWVDRVHYLGLWASYAGSQVELLFSNSKLYFNVFGQLFNGHKGNGKALLKMMMAWPKMVHAAKLVKREGLESCHAHWANIPATTAYVVGELLNKPFTMTAHAHDIYKNNVFLSQVLTKTKLCFTCTEYNRQYLLDKYPYLNPDKIQVVYHGVDTSLFKPGPPPERPFKIVSIGRMTWQKGFPILIEALAETAKRGLDIHLDLLALKGPAEKEMRTLIKKHNLENKITWLAKTKPSMINSVYQSGHAFVLPCQIGPHGERDGIPNVILEALACGIPCISTPISGIPEAVIDNWSGLLVPPSDPGALADAIEHLYRQEQLRRRFGQNGRELMQRKFDRTVCNRKLLELLESSRG